MLSQAPTPSSHVLDGYCCKRDDKEGCDAPICLPFHIYWSGVRKGTWSMSVLTFNTKPGQLIHLLLPFYSSRQEIGLVLLASELFTIYFTISILCILLSPPSGSYEGLASRYSSPPPLFTFQLFSGWRQPKHLMPLCVCVCVCIQAVKLMSGTRVIIIRNQVVRQQLEALYVSMSLKVLTTESQFQKKQRMFPQKQ